MVVILATPQASWAAQPTTHTVVLAKRDSDSTVRPERYAFTCKIFNFEESSCACHSITDSSRNLCCTTVYSEVRIILALYSLGALRSLPQVDLPRSERQALEGLPTVDAPRRG